MATSQIGFSKLYLSITLRLLDLVTLTVNFEERYLYTARCRCYAVTNEPDRFQIWFLRKATHSKWPFSEIVLEKKSN